MKNIYCISGLGADERLFVNFAVPGYALRHLHWVSYDVHDTMASYAAKMAILIDDPAPIIAGLSFGGMLAVEIAKMNPSARVILISSAVTAVEIIIHGGRLSRWLIRSMVVPARLLKIPSFTVLHYLGAGTAGEKKLLRRLIRDSNGNFMKWALKAIEGWTNSVRPPNVVHIHGTRDKTIPANRVSPDYWIDGGSHIMIYNRGPEVNALVAKCLENWQAVTVVP